MPPFLHPLPRPEDSDFAPSVERNLELLARAVERVEAKQDEHLLLGRAMRDQCVRLADEVLAARQSNAVPPPTETLLGLGPYRERAPTLPEIVAAIQTGQHQRVDSLQVDGALQRAQEKRDAATLRKMRQTGWKLVVGTIGAVLSFLAVGAIGYVIHGLIHSR